MHFEQTDHFISFAGYLYCTDAELASSSTHDDDTLNEFSVETFLHVPEYDDPPPPTQPTQEAQASQPTQEAQASPVALGGWDQHAPDRYTPDAYNKAPPVPTDDYTPPISARKPPKHARAQGRGQGRRQGHGQRGG